MLKSSSLSTHQAERLAWQTGSRGKQYLLKIVHKRHIGWWWPRLEQGILPPGPVLSPPSQDPSFIAHPLSLSQFTPSGHEQAGSENPLP